MLYLDSPCTFVSAASEERCWRPKTINFHLTLVLLQIPMKNRASWNLSYDYDDEFSRFDSTHYSAFPYHSRRAEPKKPFEKIINSGGGGPRAGFTDGWLGGSGQWTWPRDGPSPTCCVLAFEHRPFISLLTHPRV